jgi:phenylalanyl-tRNA synthetase beta subunit
VLVELTLAKPNVGVIAKRAAWLRSSGIRAISPLVDITNYVMLEHGQPMHAYDADKVKGAIVVRQAKAGEKLVTLDGVERKLTAADLVIADDSGAIGLAGVMGGAATEVDAMTKRIYLEVATFHGATVRKMAKRHSLRSEASARFERGLPVTLAPLAAAAAVELLKKELSAKLVGVTDELRVWPWVQHIGLRQSKLNDLLGITLKPKEVTDALAKLGIAAKPFNIVAEAKSHLGKPYVWGASYKKNGADAFDCSYFTDYLYSLIGQRVGHTTLAQYEIGRPVDEADLQPGDNLFYEGKAFDGDHAYDLKAIAKGEQPHSTIGHYFLWDDKSQKYVKTVAKTKRLVGHNGLYIGDGKVIHAATYRWNGKDWDKLAKPGVVISPVSEFTSNPGYLGARRYVDNLDDFIAAEHIPWWRPDLKLPEDLVEEVVRVIGYDRIPSTLPAWQPRELTFDRERAWRRRLREVLYGSGLFEVMTYSFVGEEQLRELGSDPTDYLKLSNPLSIEQAYLRRSPLPSLMATLARNAKYASEVGLYEVTGVFEPKDKGRLPDEPERLAVIWRGRSQAYGQVKGMLDRLGASLAIDFEVAASNDGRFANGRGGEVRLEGKTIGWIGQLKPALVQRHKLTGEVAYLELNLKPILAAARPVSYRPPSRFPSARRDLAVVVAEAVTWQQLHDEAAHDGLAEVSFVSDYRGGDLPEGHKSVALRLEMTAPDHTLNEAEVDDRMKVIETRLKRKLGAVPRSE